MGGRDASGAAVAADASPEESPEARFARLLNALSAEYAAVASERDRLLLGARPPQCQASTRRRGPAPPPQETEPAGSPRRRAIVVETPAVIQQRLALLDVAGDVSPATSRGPQVLRELAEEGGSCSFRLKLDARWQDLYLANELEAEVESEATKTFKRAVALHRPPDDIVRSTMLQTRATSSFVLDSGEEGQSWPRWSQVPIRPSGVFNNSWDLLCMWLILFDAIVLPMSVAWEFEAPMSSMVTIDCLWAMDIIFKFNTGYYAYDGTLIMTRSAVCRNYLSGWFAFDVLVVVVDILVLAFPGTGLLQAFRGARAIRLVRLVRLLKAGKISQGLEELLSDLGIQKMILVWAVFETVLGIFMLTHFLACSWYYLGMAGYTGGQRSWIALLGDSPEALPMSEAYCRCLYWVLGHVVAAPVDPSISPQSLGERVFTVVMIFSSLLVVGTGISKMTNAIAELNRASAEARDMKRSLRQVLRTCGVDRATSSRIVRFAVHSHHRHCHLSVDERVMSFLSKTLVSELTLCQRSSYLEKHALFKMIKEGFRDIYLNLCSSFRTNLYADNDIIFGMDTLSEVFYVTLSGTYVRRTPSLMAEETSNAPRGIRVSFGRWSGPPPSLLSRVANMDMVYSSSGGMFSSTATGSSPQMAEDGFMHETFDMPRYLCEIALFAKTFHASELRTRTFADALTLTGADLASCMRGSPKCIGIVYRYANELLACASCNLGNIDYDVVPKKLAKEVKTKLQQKNIVVSLNFESPSIDADGFEKLCEILEPRSSRLMGSREIVDFAQRLFNELDPAQGIYANLKQGEERLRALASLVCFVCFLHNDYETFTQVQSSKSKLAPETWREFQDLVSWANLGREERHAMAILLILRDLGKNVAFLKAMPLGSRSEEEVVILLVRYMSSQVPSVQSLSQSQIALIEQSLRALSVFNLAQFLQGENVPFCVSRFQTIMMEYGDRVFKFSLLAYTCLMGGIRGAESPHGSLFMGNTQAVHLLLGMRIIQAAEDKSATAIYWSYITHRARRLGLSTNTEEELVIARLVCLTRSTTCDLQWLWQCWSRLGAAERRALTHHFLADGIQEPAFVFVFLPKYLTSSRDNDNVGLHRALIVLVDILEMLDSGGFMDKTSRSTVDVSLKDLAEFVEEVANPSAFMAVIVHSSISQAGSQLTFVISTKHRHNARQSSWTDEPDNEVKAILKRMNRRVGSASIELLPVVGAMPPPSGASAATPGASPPTSRRTLVEEPQPRHGCDSFRLASEADSEILSPSLAEVQM